MRIAVLSDTHASEEKVSRVLTLLRPYLTGVDGILHAGDFTASALLEELGELAPLHGVAGNMDGPEIRGRLPEQTTVELAGKKIGLIHGWGAPAGLADKVIAKFAGKDGRPVVDVLVFGHTHQAQVERRGELLVVNPGSPTDRRFAPYRSLAILEIGPEVRAEVIKLP
jgi:uncharacterized protein